jgi:hypothetical protein
MRLVPDTDRLTPGAPVTGKLYLEEADTCTALRIRLWWAARGPDPDTDEVTVAAEQTLATGALASGVTIPFSLSIPLHPTSHEGHLVAVRWALTARIEWPDDRPDTVARVPLTLAPGALPGREQLAAGWLRQWQQRRGPSWLDRLRSMFTKFPLRLNNSATHPGDTVRLCYDGPAVAHHWRLVRIEEAARRVTLTHPRTGTRTEHRWTVEARTISEGRLPLAGEPDAGEADVRIPADAAASLLLPTRLVHWEIRVSTTGQDVVVPLVVLPGW